MKVLIVNPIIYTSETRDIKKVNTIKDTMIYDLCLGFMQKGHEITLATCEDYKPLENEEYPFEVVWMRAKLKRLCPVNSLPYCPEVKALAKKGGYDLIITSEVFSLNSLMLSMSMPKRVIVWHELAKHNRIFKGIASRVWYGIIARLFFGKVLVVPRSIEARDFIAQYCRNVSDIIIDHGVNLDKFELSTDKDNTFVVSSQLIGRKRIDRIINAFDKYLKKYDNEARLIIMGDGEERESLEALVNELGIGDNVTFTGRLNHSELITYLKKARAMLVYTEKDNNMVSIVESIAVGTPIVTTSVPYNATYIKANELGIVSDEWNEDDLNEVAKNSKYIASCASYRKTISTLNKVEKFEEAKNQGAK